MKAPREDPGGRCLELVVERVQLPAGVPGAYRLFVNLLSQTLHARQHE